jgi:hypothetical protein
MLALDFMKAARSGEVQVKHEQEGVVIDAEDNDEDVPF